MNTDAETLLVKKAQKGDQHAFGTLVQNHQIFVYNLALKTVSHVQEAEDITQETFIRAWKALPNFLYLSSFRTWLYRITVNLCYNRNPHLKRELSVLSLEDNNLDIPTFYNSDPGLIYEKDELKVRLAKEITTLSTSYQMMIQLRYQQGFSYDEIAQIMNIPLGTVKTGLNRAHKHLKTKLTLEHEVPV